MGTHQGIQKGFDLTVSFEMGIFFHKGLNDPLHAPFGLGRLLNFRTGGKGPIAVSPRFEEENGR